MRSNNKSGYARKEKRRQAPPRRYNNNPLRKTALQERLPDVMVLELHENGDHQKYRKTLRGLYDHVMMAITSIHRNRVQDNCGSSRSRRIRSVSIGGELESHQPPPTSQSQIQIPSNDASPSLPLLPLGTISEVPVPISTDAGINDNLNATNLPNGNVNAQANTRINTNGNAMERTKSTSENEQRQQSVTIRERLGGYLHPRDMRRLVTPFSASNEPELMVRRHVMLLNFDPLRAIVLRDRLLVLVPDGADSILMDLEKMVRGGIDEMVFGEGEDFNPESTLGDASIEDESSTEHTADANEAASLTESDHQGDIFEKEWEEFEGGDWIKLTFELQSVDAVLSKAVKMLSEDSLELRTKISRVMKDMRGDTTKRSQTTVPGDHTQEQLRILKDKVREMEGRVQGFVRAINQILDDEEDMALMNLSRLITHPDRFIQPVPQHILEEESDEPELILEVHLQQALSEVNALELLKGNVLNTEELVTLQMDTVRNRLLYINTVVSVFSLSVASASLVGSIFGMNLTNHMEDDQDTFMNVVIGTLSFSAVILVFVLWLISKTGVMPANSQRLLFSNRNVDIAARS